MEHDSHIMAQNSCSGKGNGCAGGRSFCEMYRDMGDYAPETLKAINKFDPSLMDTIAVMDRIMVNDGALDKVYLWKRLDRRGSQIAVFEL